MKGHPRFASFLLSSFLVTLFLASGLITGPQGSLASDGASNEAGQPEPRAGGLYYLQDTSPTVAHYKNNHHLAPRPVSYSPFVNTFSLSLNPNGPSMSQYMRTGSGGGLNITSSLTVEAWIKPNTGDGVSARAIISRYQDVATSPAQGGYYLRLNPANKLRFSIYQNAPGGVGKTITGSTTVTDNQWHHVVGIYDGVTKLLRVYLDGNNDASPVSSSTGSSSTSNSFRVGASNNTTEYFNGLIDEVRATAAVVYSANFTPQASLDPTTGCKGLWKFDNADGADSSGNNNPGAFFNSPGFSSDVPGAGSPPPNQPPVANAGGPYSGATGTAIQFNGAGSSDPDGFIASYTWNFGDGGTANGASPTHAYASAGTYTVTLTVTDNGGATSSPSTTTASITNTPPPPNQPPVANPGGPYTGTVGASASFNGANSSDPDGTVVSYDWDFGDGTTHGTGPTPTHIYASATTYTVTLRVTDNRGAQSSPGSTTANITSTPPPPPSGFNLALNRPADQSSTATYGVVSSANLAVDGNTSGDYSGGVGSVSHTNQENQPWWRVDLGSSQSIQRIDVWNRTDCCPERLSNFYVFVSNVEFNSASVNGTISQMSATGGSTYFTAATAGSPTSLTINRSGRYVRVQLASTSGILSLAEVLVWGNTAPPTPPPTGDNLALNRPAVQSSTATFGVVSYASLAVDGNTSGDYSGGVGSVSHTNQENQPWWRVDLGSSQSIQRIDVWNRTDCCPERLSNFYVFVSNVEFSSATVDGTLSQMAATGGASYFMSAQAGSPTTFTIGRSGRYVRVQLASASGILSLAEVQVWRTTAPPPPPPPPTGDNFSKARIDPINRIGSPGEDLFSGNFNWSLPVLNLPGRAGLDLNLAIVYNSLIWTKDGSSIKFDADNGYPAPGFRLGFPVIQAQKYTSESGALAYLMILPSGYRVELRRVGATGFYEAADSSYLQLDESTMTVRATDGTQFTYSLGSNTLELECRQIKDRNGNYITINYNGSDRIATIIDTLARTISFLYDVNNNLQYINQTWNGSSHTWATFSYTSRSIVTNFQSSLTRTAPSSFWALTQVALSDGSRFNFDYTSYGQVKRVSNYAADNHLLNYTSYNLPESTGAQQSDCPRFSERRDMAENWIGGGEAVTSFIINPGSSSGQVTTPDNTVTAESFSTSGWRKGLTAQMQIFAPGLVKTTLLTWAHSGAETDSYKTNPRVTDTRVTDDQGNVKRTETLYTTFTLPSGAMCSLPGDVIEYNAGGVTPLRRNHTDYSLDANYINRRIIGLPSRVSLYDGSGNLFSKVDYGYDWGIVNTAAVTSHDSSYNAGFIVGRANLSGVGRWNINAPADSSQIAWTNRGYDINGSLVHVRDALGHGPDISYADAFSAGTSPGLTLAYPTRITDADGFSSTMQHHYDIGLPTQAQDPKGAVVTISYDGAGRVSRTDISNGGYTRFDYPSSLTEVRAYRAVDVGVEAYSAQVTDGARRVIGAVRNHPGSTGGYSGQKMVYDAMGRLAQQSNPTEIFYTPGQAVSSWSPAGDDASAGWAYTTQQYDWNSRPTITTNADFTTRRIDYTGCGCAGGEVVTLMDEVGRKQSLTFDVRGRIRSQKIFNSDGTAVYSTTTTTYNVRDQITEIAQQQGTSGTVIRTTMTYDGHERLETAKAPIQTSPTVYAYRADDSIDTVTDARGAATFYTYNNRRLVTGIGYFAPPGVAAAPGVTFGYDAAGNRTSMTDGAGSVTYVYDTWSRLTSERRQFSNLGSMYTITYTYNLAGQIKTITDPFNAIINYAYDQAGRVMGVTGSNFSNVTQYAGAIRYRAWGALKHLDNGNGRPLNIAYDNRQHMTAFNGEVVGSNYQYYNDGRIKYAQSLLNADFDRKYVYDHAGRLSEALSGSEARGGSITDGPYRQSYQYDVWNNMVGRINRYWSQQQNPYTANYVNDRNQNPNWQYDGEGHILHDDAGDHLYDAAGMNVGANGTFINQSYDGFGLPAKRVEIRPFLEDRSTIYYVRSTVLGGQTITELNSSGQKRRTYVYLSGALLAKQERRGSGLPDEVVWIHIDPITGSRVETRENALIYAAEEIDPLGGLIGGDPGNLPPDDYFTQKGNSPTHDVDADPFDPGSGCTLDGVPFSCGLALNKLNNGSVAIAPLQRVQAFTTESGQRVLAVFEAPLGEEPGFRRLTGSGKVRLIDDDGKVIQEYPWKEKIARVEAPLSTMNFMQAKQDKNNSRVFKNHQPTEERPVDGFASALEQINDILQRWGYERRMKEGLDKGWLMDVETGYVHTHKGLNPHFYYPPDISDRCDSPTGACIGARKTGCNTWPNGCWFPELEEGVLAPTKPNKVFYYNYKPQPYGPPAPKQ